MNPSVIALLHGSDQPGLVARTASWIHQRGGNVLHADQHLDRDENIFFQRVEWQPSTPHSLEEEMELFKHLVKGEFGMKVRLTRSDYRPRIALMVSKADHCFHDLALRQRAGDWNADLVGVLSNHEVLEPVAQSYGLNYLRHSVTKENKAGAEAKQLTWLADQQVDLLILARYMQVLSPDFLKKIACPVINIHHSFLPSFAGAKPYHQAHKRGVKLIGATAHFVTRDLDEGPIIEQDVARVDHSKTVEDLTTQGRDTESQVLARAVKWHSEHRVLLNGHKTVIFK